jgi:glucosamine-phosphate N-acetyltransferase
VIRELSYRDINDRQEELKKLYEQLSVVGDWNRNEVEKAYWNNDHTKKDFIFEFGGKIVGAASLIIDYKFIHLGQSAAFLEDVVVAEGYRGLGIGKALVNRCLEEAMQSRAYKVILTCSDSNVEYYRKLGFEINGVAMRLNLE